MELPGWVFGKWLISWRLKNNIENRFRNDHLLRQTQTNGDTIFSIQNEKLGDSQVFAVFGNNAEALRYFRSFRPGISKLH